MKSIQRRQNKIISTVHWPSRISPLPLQKGNGKKPLGEKYTSIFQQGKKKLRKSS